MRVYHHDTPSFSKSALLIYLLRNVVIKTDLPNTIYHVNLCYAMIYTNNEKRYAMTVV